MSPLGPSIKGVVGAGVVVVVVVVVVAAVVDFGQLSSLHLTCVLTQRQIEQPSGPSLNSSRSRYQLFSCKHENGAKTMTGLYKLFQENQEI